MVKFWLLTKISLFCGGFEDFAENFSRWKDLMRDRTIPQVSVEEKSQTEIFYYFLNWWNLPQK